MPSPVGHTIFGLAFARVSNVPLARNSWTEVAVVAFLANLPDLDFLPGYLLGEPTLYHRSISHTLLAAIAAGVVTALVYRALGREVLPYLMLGAALFGSHLLLDVTTGPGVPLFWPLLDGDVQTQWSVFMELDKAGTSEGFLRSLLSGHNAMVALWEAVLVLPVLLTAELIRTRDRRRPALGKRPMPATENE
jgi:membrane-bound metal-dependent hydrolase YbcI (DUF457 family)